VEGEALGDVGVRETFLAGALLEFGEEAEVLCANGLEIDDVE